MGVRQRANQAKCRPPSRPNPCPTETMAGEGLRPGERTGYHCVPACQSLIKAEAPASLINMGEPVPYFLTVTVGFAPACGRTALSCSWAPRDPHWAQPGGSGRGVGGISGSGSAVIAGVRGSWPWHLHGPRSGNLSPSQQTDEPPRPQGNGRYDLINLDPGPAPRRLQRRRGTSICRSWSPKASAVSV